VGLLRATRLLMPVLIILFYIAPAQPASIYEGPNGEIYIGDHLPRELEEKGYTQRGKKKASLHPAGNHKDFLWKVESKGNRVYVLGSVHLGTKELFPLSTAIEGAFEECDSLAVEANVSPGNVLRNRDQIGKALLESMLYPEGDTIEKHISKKTYGLLAAKLSEMGASIDQFRGMRPWFISLLFEIGELAEEGLSPEFGIDTHFLRKAEGKKEILELEGLAFQMSMFKNFTDGEEEALLLYSINGREDDNLRNILAAWAAGDAEGMQDLIEKDIKNSPDMLALMEKFLYGRNRKMAAKIEGYLAGKEQVFVIAGAAHLVGKKGIIELLRKKGYAVEQVRTKKPPAAAAAAAGTLK